MPERMHLLHHFGNIEVGMRRPIGWILIADATHARVVKGPRRSDDLHGPPLETVFETSTDHRPLRKIMADRPGRSFASTGARRSAMEYRSDPVRDETRRFAASIVSALQARFERGEFDKLMICAPPRMLNALRKTLPEALAAVVRSEVAKDLSKLPELELHKRLEDLSGAPN